MIILYISIFVIGIISAVYLYKWRKKISEQRDKEAWMAKKKYKLLHILVPKNNEKSPVSAEQMFASIHGIFRPDEKWQEQISLEIISRDKFIHFYVRIPEELKDFVEGQIYAQYPDVEIFEVEDYAQEKPNTAAFAGTKLKLNKNDVYPIKTFINFTVDPLAAITSVLTKTAEREEIWIQIIVRPVSDVWQDRGIAHIEAIRSGSLSDGNIWKKIFKGFSHFVFDLVRTAINPTSAESAEPSSEIKLSGPQEASLKGIEEKITKLGFETKIRIMCFSGDKYSAKAKVNIVAGVFKQFNTINLNGFEPERVTTNPDFFNRYRQRMFVNDGFVLNIEELASLYHLPNVTVETPNIVWAGSKKGEPPSNLPIIGRIDNKAMVVFGKTDFRHNTQQFGIKTADRRLHMYAIGKTGTGKSTMLENMVVDDIRNGKGVAVVDPHGELINHILDFIPPERISDVIYFNPADNNWPVGFNPLESVNPELKNIVASGVVGIFKKIFGESWGPRLEYILRNAILALLDYPDSTLLGVMRILVDNDFRKKVVARIHDPVVKDFFVNEYNRWDQKFRLEAIQSIQNKVGQFLSSSNIRNIVGQAKSTFDIRRAMDEGKILLLDLSIGKIGEDNAALLGSLLITKIQLSAMQRVDVPEVERRDFYLYVDEFQNFATDSFAVILSEARKYHLNLIMTHQYIAQMPETVREAVFGNVGTIISFRVGSSDAGVLAKEFEPVFETNDLVNLDNYHIYVKMAIDGVTRPAFSAITLPPYTEKHENREEIIKLSREKYAKPRAFVEEQIMQWSQRDEQIESINLPTIKKEGQAENEERIMFNNFIYAHLTDKNNNKWFIPTDYEKESVKAGESQKSLLKPILEAKKTRAQTRREIDELITLSDIEEIITPKKSDDLKKMKAGESVKIQ